MDNAISKKLAEHYSASFDKHGPSTQGVDWGEDDRLLHLRYRKMLSVLDVATPATLSLLDAGCGFGGLLKFALNSEIQIDYTGIDAATNMVEWAASNNPAGTFICGDVLSHPFESTFDYVICNGILTQKLDTPALEMDYYAQNLIRRLFSLCRRGLAFNIMTSKVNFYSNNLYYRNPSELLAWCLAELTPRVKLDHSYQLYEYTMYLYHPTTD